MHRDYPLERMMLFEKSLTKQEIDEVIHYIQR